jgi:hypothetical protein
MESRLFSSSFQLDNTLNYEMPSTRLSLKFCSRDPVIASTVAPGFECGSRGIWYDDPPLTIYFFAATAEFPEDRRIMENSTSATIHVSQVVSRQMHVMGEENRFYLGARNHAVPRITSLPFQDDFSPREEERPRFQLSSQYLHDGPSVKRSRSSVSPRMG